MTTPTHARGPLATVDVRELNSVKWGPFRQMFPWFVEELELGRYLRTLLATGQCIAVRIEAHRQPDGSASTHVYDVYRVGDDAA